ncbi:CRISPR-associated endonuclease Cas1 [Nitrosomonas sp. Is37]|uniref:CRISPR-associated endonuclease Cas1 n=1 Tax=Nitrosomonas sp. Is37 TaxID=3080535 RepID=UPI00294B07FA|nr:CRISPR-associated endonuclease Cas1 [Nitrosomonas sp. Is37]MDV6344070.1 CRISPR-associated endonuclease Cas1 [Nitrosomonas sp. Is37]
MSKRQFKEPLDCRPKRFTREDGGESVQHFLPMRELRASSNYWLKRLRTSTVITLTGISPSVSVDNDSLVIKQGATLADMAPPTTRYPRGVHRLAWVVIDSPNGFVTIDALHWLESQRIGLMMCSGGNTSVLLQHVDKPIVSLRRAQYSGNVVVIARWVLRGKLAACLDAFPDLPNAQELHELLHGDTLSQLVSVNDLRLVEGRIAGAYWKHHTFTLNHYAKFPPWWSEFDRRSSGIGNTGNRHATHPVNAILNYAYTVVAGIVKRHCALLGLDTAVGSLHADNDRRDSLVWDLLELIRADIDKLLLTWMKSVKWRRTDFLTSERGVVSLDTNLRRVVVEKVSTLQSSVERIVKDYTLFLLRL